MQAYTICILCVIYSVYINEFSNGVFMQAEWEDDTSLKGKIFSGAIFSGSAKTKLLCVSICMSVPCCRFLTYNSNTMMCRGHRISFDTGSSFTPDPASIAVRATESTMDKGWIYTYEPSVDLCYAIKWTEKVTWSKAFERCQEEGSNLVSLNTKEKLNILQSFFPLLCWVGLTFNPTEGKWRWLNGDVIAVNSELWFPGEPDSKLIPPEYCGGIFISGLNDYECDGFNLTFVCEKD